MFSVALALSLASPAPARERKAFDCARFFHNACSEALGAWLPSYARSNDAWQRRAATHISRRDRFVYEGERPKTPQLFGFQGPEDGTFFVYGNAGPPRGHVVYDYAHRLTFYDQGCCSWHDVVAAADVPSPPKGVVARNLISLHTIRGIRLGQTPSQVMHIYGKSALLAVPGYSKVRMLAYTTWPPARTLTTIHTCGQFENFFFHRDRLMLIQLGNGC